MLPEAPSLDRRTRRRICKISLIRVAVSPVSLSAVLPLHLSERKTLSRPVRQYLVVSFPPAGRLSVSISTTPHVYPVSTLSGAAAAEGTTAAASSARARTSTALSASRSITNAAEFLIGDTRGGRYTTHLQCSRVRVQSLVHWI